MTLIYDSGADHANVPGVHALIVGVSSYPNLEGGHTAQPENYGLGQLTSAATSAYSVYEGLMQRRTQLAKPLGTCRLLLCPAPSEADLPVVDEATLDQFLANADAWREVLKHQDESIAFFYFAGHGVQRGSRDAVLLLRDFNQRSGGRLMNAVDTGNLHEALSPSQGHCTSIARTQLFFVDACRVEPIEFLKFHRHDTTPIFDLTRGATVPDDRCAPLWFATMPGSIAQALPHRQTYFSMALWKGLDLAAYNVEEDASGGRRWPVGVWQLPQALTYAMEEVLRTYGGRQDVYSDGPVPRNAVLQYLPHPPEIAVTIQVDPAAATAGSLELRDSQDEPLESLLAWSHEERLSNPVCPIAPHPCRIRLPMGNYSVLLTFSPDALSFKNCRVIKSAGVWPDQRHWSIKIR